MRDHDCCNRPDEDARRAPSPGWRLPRWRPATSRDLGLLWSWWIEQVGAAFTVLQRIEQEMKKMAINTEHLRDDLQKVRTGWASLIAERDQYKAALEQADADKAQAVADALAADNAVDQAAVDEADALIHDLVNEAPAGDEGGPVSEPAPDQPAPAEENDGDNAA